MLAARDSVGECAGEGRGQRRGRGEETDAESDFLAQVEEREEVNYAGAARGMEGFRLLFDIWERWEMNERGTYAKAASKAPSQNRKAIAPLQFTAAACKVEIKPLVPIS